MIKEVGIKRRVARQILEIGNVPTVLVMTLVREAIEPLRVFDSAITRAAARALQNHLCHLHIGPAYITLATISNPTRDIDPNTYTASV